MKKASTVSQEVRDKISKSLSGRKRKPFTKEWREKLGLSKRGKTWEEIYGDKAIVIRIHHKEALNRPEVKEKISKSQKKVWERKKRKEKINRVLNKVKRFFIGRKR